MSYEDQDETPEDIDQPMNSGGDFKPLALLPEREWLFARIADVKYVYVMFNGVRQTVKDQNKNEILVDGKPIERKQFKITFEFKHYQLDNGKPRKQWLQIGASLNLKANLPLFLFNLGFNAKEGETTPSQIVGMIKGMEVKLQLVNKPVKDKLGEFKQRVVWDAVKSVDLKTTTGIAGPSALEQADAHLNQ